MSGISRFEMPAAVVKDESTAGPGYARFTAEPFESGYARTIGNSLRRVLLSSIEGAAITAVKIKGASHEFCSIPGVSEDVTDIVIALKQVLIKVSGAVPERISISRKGPCVVTAGDFVTGNAIEIVNPGLRIATVSDGVDFELEAEVAVGRGFHPADWNKREDQEIGVIAIDSIFSPVTRVNYGIEPKRVGNRTDYETLVVDVWTDGRITPDEALRTGAALLRRHFDVFAAAGAAGGESAEAAGGEVVSSDERRAKLAKVLATSVNEIELSVRAANCLNNANITTVGALVCKTEADMLKYRNFGKKSLNEIKEKLAALGVALGSDIDPELLAQYRDKDAGEPEEPAGE